jgi:hypothetical protein
MTRGLASACGVVGAVLLLVLAFGAAQPTYAVDLSGLNTLALDVNTTGNTSTTHGTIQNCAVIPVGGSVIVDVVVDAIPDPTPGGIAGFGMNILYTFGAGAGGLSVTARPDPIAAGDGKSLLSNNANSAVSNTFNNTVPDSDGNFAIVQLDGAPTYEAGVGKLYFFTVTSVGTAGTATLDLTDSSAVTGTGTAGGDDDLIPDLYVDDTSSYTIGSILDAQIIVGSDPNACTPGTPTPTPTPTPPGQTPTPTPSPTPPGQTPTPTPTPTPPGQTPTPTPSPTPPGQTPTPTPTPTPPGQTPTPTPSGTQAAGSATPTKTAAGLPKTGGVSDADDVSGWLILVLGAASIVVAGGSLLTARVTRKD